MHDNDDAAARGYRVVDDTGFGEECPTHGQEKRIKCSVRSISYPVVDNKDEDSKTVLAVFLV